MDPGYGALVISLDFELHWGNRDHISLDGLYRQNLIGVRQAVPEMLALFREYEVAATWATVGFLFARGRVELSQFAPARRPVYVDPSLDPYHEPLGEDEASDPFHFAPSLIAEIQASERQEIGTHTFSHYYCLEPYQTREAFRSDLEAAVAISGKYGVRPRSMVFPRNQHNPAYDEVLKELGVVVYRGNPRGWMYRASGASGEVAWKRLARLADSYVGLTPPRTAAWSDLLQPNGLCDVPASFFIRPYSRRFQALEPLRLRRIAQSIRHAAQHARLVHLWWHPHNFGTNLRENLDFLRRLLDVYADCRVQYSMQSLTMYEAYEKVAPSVTEARP